MIDLCYIALRFEGNKTAAIISRVTVNCFPFGVMAHGIWRVRETVSFVSPRVLARVVQRMDIAIRRINHYPVDSVVCFVNTYPLDSDLSGG